MTLAAQWIEAKAAEQAAIAHRRAIEDELASSLSLKPDLDGSETFTKDGYAIKVTGRIDRKVDADKLQDLATAAGLSDHLSSLFRWKPEINMAVWKAAAPSITSPLAGAITAKPGRPSFSITTKEN